MKLLHCKVLSLSALLLGCFAATPVAAYSFVAPGYSQEIYTGEIGGLGWGPGLAWKPVGSNLLLRGNNQIYEYSLTADTVHGGNPVHSFVAHAVAGDNSGYGMTNGLDGYLYGIGGTGLVKIDTATWTATLLVGTIGGYYGITTLADGRIVYSDTQSIYAYDPVALTNTFLYNANSFVDGIAATSTGEIFLSVLGANRVDVFSTVTNTLVNSVFVSHSPDGMAFGGGGAYANNTDGTITRLDFAGAGYTGALTESIIASGGSYGDLAAAGPDCAFYVSQWGDTPAGAGNHITRITKDDGTCGFDPGGGLPGVPEPATGALIGLGALGFGMLRRRKLVLA